MIGYIRVTFVHGEQVLDGWKSSNSRDDPSRYFISNIKFRGSKNVNEKKERKKNRKGYKRTVYGNTRRFFIVCVWGVSRNKSIKLNKL